MRVYNKIGSKERFVEMFQNVNKLKLNETEVIKSEDILTRKLMQLRNGELSVKQSNTIVNGDETSVELGCTDNDGGDMIFSILTVTNEGDQDDVYNVTGAKLSSFTYTNGDNNIDVIMKGDMLDEFNSQHVDDLVSIASEYIDFKDKPSAEEIGSEDDLDESYMDAVKKIDSYPFGGTPRTMKKSEDYGDNQPTNPDLRVNSKESDKFVDEEISLDNSNVVEKQFDSLQMETRLKFYKLATKLIYEEILSMNLDPDNMPSLKIDEARRKLALQLFSDHLVNVNEGNDYPKEMGKKFKTKKQYSPEKKKKESTTNLSEEMITGADGENLSIGDVVTVDGFTGEYQIVVSNTEQKPFLVPFNMESRSADASRKIYLTALANPKMTKVMSYADTEGGYMGESDDIDNYNPINVGENI